MFGPPSYITATARYLLAAYLELAGARRRPRRGCKSGHHRRATSRQRTRARGGPAGTHEKRFDQGRTVPPGGGPRLEERTASTGVPTPDHRRHQPRIRGAHSGRRGQRYHRTVRFEVASSFGGLVRGNVVGRAWLRSATTGANTVDLRAASIAALCRLLKDQEGTTRVAAAE